MQSALDGTRHHATPVVSTKHNIIPANATMRGSLRTFNAEVRTQIIERLGSFVSSIA